MVDFIGTLVLISICFFISLKCTKGPFIRLDDTRPLLCYAVLSALAAGRLIRWFDFHSMLYIAALPILSQYSAGFYPYQLANLFGIYKEIYESEHGIGQTIMSITIYSYLIFASQDPKKLAFLINIKDILLCTEELRLVKIQKIRDIVFGDIKNLPERMRLKNAVNTFIYDVNEPLFLIRAIIKMLWRPMLPLYILSAITRVLAVASSAADSRIMNFMDSPSDHSWYTGYMFVSIEFALIVCTKQIDRIESYMNEEIYLIKNAIKVHLFRVPLLNKGLQDYERTHKALQFDVNDLTTYLVNSQAIISSMAGVFVTFIPLYVRVGWISLIPFGVALVQRLLSNCYRMVFGNQYLWQPNYYVNHDKKMSDIYHNIKSIKMFGWERMYLDPKLQKYWKQFGSKEKKPWHALLAKVSWFISKVFHTVAMNVSSLFIFYFHLQRSSGSSQQISTGDMFWINNLINQMQYSIDVFVSGLSSLNSFIESNRRMEDVLRGNLISSLPHYPMDKTKQHDIGNGKPADYSRPSVCIDNSAFSWDKKNPVLKDVSFSVEQGELVAVVGKTGTGKTSLLLSICGEVELTAGTGAVIGSLALVEQTPWIMSGTLRENILFGRDYDEEYYNKVVYACALVEDISNWAKKDLTVIGERGINISGGQKARLALARAVYSRADIYILDDPLSAVDAHVKRHILDNVIMDSGLLAGRIRIVSTNMQSLLPYFDKVLSLVGNKSVDVLRNTRKDYQPVKENADIVLDCADTLAEVPNNVIDTAQALNASDNTSGVSDENSEGSSEITSKSWSNWDNVKFVFKMCGVPTMAIILVSALFKPMSRFIFDTYKLEVLRDNQGTFSLTNSAIQKYLFIEMLKHGSIDLIHCIEDYINNVISEQYLGSHIKNEFIKRLIHARLAFFDSTSRQEISSAYNYGTNAMSRQIPDFLREKTSNILDAILSIYRVGTSAPQLLIFVPLLVWTSIKRGSIGASVESAMDKIEIQVLVNGRKVYANIEGGVSLIRIFDVEKHFTGLYMDERDKEFSIWKPQRVFYTFKSLLYEISYGIVFGLCKLSSLVQTQVFGYDTSSVELDTYTNLVDMLALSIESITELICDAFCFKKDVESFRQYIGIEGERMFVENATKPGDHWPSAGRIEFRNFSMKYREDLEHVLKDINMTINQGEKVGIVGRTGAGKTSLTRALFRLIDSKTCSGTIVIDGQDIFSLNIGDLRPNLGIIPQEPTMFEGSFRQNLDPLLKYTIEDMWSAIIKCGIVENIEPKNSRNTCNDDKTNVYEMERIKAWNTEWKLSNWLKRLFMITFITQPKLDETVTWDNVRPHSLRRHVDNSFSDGQQQIFGLCRLLMRNHKIVVLDEATANVDLETDKRMQKLIRSEFKDCTVLTIAHRLETIMNSDRIVVMDNGRIAEIGSPTELLEKNGHFAELVNANDFGQ